MDIRKSSAGIFAVSGLGARLSQEAVAERMGVDRAHVSSMERGQQNVTLLTLWQAAQALECRPAAFLDEGSSSSSPETLAKAPRRKRTKS